MQQHIVQVYRESGEQRALMREPKIMFEEFAGPGKKRHIVCPNCNHHQSAKRSNLYKTKALDHVSADIFFDCASRFARDDSAASMNSLSTRFTGSPDYILERSASFYIERPTMEGLYNDPLFVVAMKQNYIQNQLTHIYYLFYAQNTRCWQRLIVAATFKNFQDVLAIPQVSTPDNNDNVCKVLPDSVRTILNTLLPCTPLYSSVTRVSFCLLKDRSGGLVEDLPRIETAEDSVEIELSKETDILHEIEIMALRILQETEIEVTSRMSSACFTVRLHGRLCVERKMPFASAGLDSENGLQGFFNDLKLLNKLQGGQGILQLIGVIYTRLQPKSYVYEACGGLYNTSYFKE